MRRAIVHCAAGVILAAGLAAPAFAASGEAAFAKAVESCVARKTKAFPDVLTAEELTAVTAENTRVNGDEVAYNGPLHQVNSDSGRVYRLEAENHCTVWAFDVDTDKAIEATGQRIWPAPYNARQASFMRGKPPIASYKGARVLMNAWVVNIPGDQARVLGGEPIGRPPRTVLVTVGMGDIH
jgi:hypothetical protein